MSITDGSFNYDDIAALPDSALVGEGTGEVIVHLPLDRTFTSSRVFVNAGFQQKITITDLPEDSGGKGIIGKLPLPPTKGEKVEIVNAIKTFTTPTSGSVLGYPVKIKASHLDLNTGASGANLIHVHDESSSDATDTVRIIRVKCDDGGGGPNGGTDQDFDDVYITFRYEK